MEMCVGDSAGLQCDVIGRPIPTVTLLINGVPIRTSPGNLSHHFQRFTEKQFGEYTCLARNSVKAVNVTINLKKKRKYIYQKIMFCPYYYFTLLKLGKYSK